MVVFIDKGDAASGMSNWSQQMQSFLQALERISQQLSASASTKQGENNRGQEEEIDRPCEKSHEDAGTLSKEDNNIVNQAIAEITLSLLDKFVGQVGQGYESESYSIKVKVEPQRNEYAIHLREDDSEIFKFQKSSSQDLTFIESDVAISSQEKLDFVNAFRNDFGNNKSKNKSPLNLKNIQTYGSLAPLGSKAIQSAINVLSIKNTSIETGEIYEFMRHDSGQVDISRTDKSQDQRLLYRYSMSSGEGITVFSAVNEGDHKALEKLFYSSAKIMEVREDLKKAPVLSEPAR